MEDAPLMAITTDCLVLGSGIAGLTFALTAAAHGSVLIVTKRGRDESAFRRGGSPMPGSSRGV